MIIWYLGITGSKVSGVATMYRKALRWIVTNDLVEAEKPRWMRDEENRYKWQYFEEPMQS